MGRIIYPIYEMENKSHVPKHQPDSWRYTPSSGSPMYVYRKQILQFWTSAASRRKEPSDNQADVLKLDEGGSGLETDGQLG